MAANNRTTEVLGAKVDSSTYHDAIYKLSQASALCFAIGAASNTGALPDDTIDMSLTAVSDLLKGVQEQVTQIYEASRANGAR